MGDLKKKKVDYVAKTDDGEEILLRAVKCQRMNRLLSF